MVTNKALDELKAWANAAHEGRGEDAKQHLVAFAHVVSGLVASGEFCRRCQELYGEEFEPRDIDRTKWLLDAIANVEVQQIEAFGPAGYDQAASTLP
jgi:hypothetical protein